MVLLDIPPSRDYFTSLFEGLGWAPDVRYHSPSFELVRGLVGHGLGYALLATKPANDMTYDGKALATRPLSDDVAESAIVLAWRKARSLSPIAEAFRRHCRTTFSQT